MFAKQQIEKTCLTDVAGQRLEKTCLTDFVGQGEFGTAFLALKRSAYDSGTVRSMVDAIWKKE